MIRAAILFTFFCIAYFQGYGQVVVWRTIFYNDSQFKYFTSLDGEPTTDWRNQGFDDSSWATGTGGIGYGDGDDGTVLDDVTNDYSAIFLRKEFQIVDHTEVSQMALSIDYDDAFIAYLNGVEIARSAGLSDAFPASAVISSTQHEANIPQGGKPDTYFIEQSLIETLMVTGTNVLAVQVHNASLASSDMSSSTWLTVGLNVNADRYLDTPEWFEGLPFNVQNLITNLPIMVIETANNQSIPDEPKMTAHMGLIDNGPNQMNAMQDAFNAYDGFIGIERRGNSTQSFPKTPYSFETRDEIGDNKNVSLLGMPEENDWILRASYLDHTFIRDALANHMSRMTGRWASRTRHVELILNGEYQGIYVLMEKIKQDKGRLDVAKLLSTDISGEELTGGYIWKVDGFSNEFGFNRSMVDPQTEDLAAEQFNYIKQVDDDFRSMMNGTPEVYGDPNEGFVKHINVESFISEMIVQEAMRNIDSYAWSAYFHKDKNGLIHAGPVWDFDQSGGNSNWIDDGLYTSWLFDHPAKGDTPNFWKKLFDDPFYKYSFKLRWNELRADKFSDASLFAYIDSIASELAIPQTREFQKWPVLGQYVWRETSGFDQRDTYQKEVDYLKEFISNRLSWIDKQFITLAKPLNYPSILAVQIDPIEELLSKESIYIDLDETFFYPYNSGLKYRAWTSTNDVVTVDVKKTDSLKITFVGAGNTEISIEARDTYGNVEVLKFDLTIIQPLASEGDPMVLIYPNPTSKILTIEGQEQIDQIRIYSVSGAVQFEDSFDQMSNIDIDLSSYPTGIYIIQIDYHNGVNDQFKVVKE